MFKFVLLRLEVLCQLHCQLSRFEPGERKEEKAGKDLSLGAGRGAEECQGGWMRGGNMYRVGKILQLDGRNANIERSLSFPESDSGLFLGGGVYHTSCEQHFSA